MSAMRENNRKRQLRISKEKHETPHIVARPNKSNSRGVSPDLCNNRSPGSRRGNNNMTLELEQQFKLKIQKLPETLKELYEKPPLPTKEEMCERLLELAEAGDEKAKEIYEEACK